MNVNDFVAKAKFPPNWQEKHLQDYIDRRLKQLGYKTETEVWCGENCGRADIVADLPDKPDYPGDLIEVKRWLTREDIFQARGQAESYQKLIKSNVEGKLRNITVIGMAPTDPEEYRKASVAKKLCIQSGIDVIFVNEEEIFYPSYARVSVGVESWKPDIIASEQEQATSNQTESYKLKEEECILNLNYPFGKVYIKYKRANHCINDVARGVSHFAKQVLAIAKLIVKVIKFIIKIINSMYLLFKRLTRKKYKGYKKNQVSKYLKFIWVGFGIFYLFMASIEFGSKFNLSNQTQIIRKSK
ncbi:hypothetical protein CAL7716_085880 [Calothrix sp. PCC 7716]|nr:hypothetical protein CAL7716_085880 [Calothrix sp. PCC 7716]